MEELFQLSNIEDAVKDFKNGKFVIVVDDEDRENEGDLIIAAEKITPEDVNFMLVHARGVLCAPITKSRCKELDLPHQVTNNTSMLGTPFTTVPLQSERWLTPRRHLRHLAVRATSIPCMPRTMACCAVVVIRKHVSTCAAWPDYILQVRLWK